MVSDIGQLEIATQDKVIKLFVDTLGYNYLGDWRDRENNSNVEEIYLKEFLAKQGYDSELINRAINEFTKGVTNQAKSLYDKNKEVYNLLRYGLKIKTSVSEINQTIHFIDWENPENNNFALASEVTIKGNDGADKRPDLILYVNGIALAIIELKRSTVSVAEGIRQNLDSQNKKFIQHFFSTIQFVLAGNETEGLRYGTIETKEKYFLTWKEENTQNDDNKQSNQLIRHLRQLCNKKRFLELIHDFIVFDSGTKKISRHNQYFGVKHAQNSIKEKKGGIIWHTQGSGKSITMVWLAKWIRENQNNSRILIITDRTELDEQIERIFNGVNEKIYRTQSGQDLITQLNDSRHSIICSLIHKFGSKSEDVSIDEFIEEINKSLSSDFTPYGNLFVFVDECHRTQSGKLHQAMKLILPEALFIGFTGTPILAKDKVKSTQIFGSYIHTYKFDEAIKDGVILDLKYEARNIDQSITSRHKIDQWFEAKTAQLSDFAKAKLKQKWGTMQNVLSSESRLNKIVADIILDMNTKPRLESGLGNAMLIASNIYEACKYYDLFQKLDLKGRCAIVTSYNPNINDIKGEETGEGQTDRQFKYEIYQNMFEDLKDLYSTGNNSDTSNPSNFEVEIQKRFIKEPSKMKLLIVVDKLLTGFDAPSATYLYIDKQMQDHGLFQAICRVNRLDGNDKEFGYIVDYKDLFKNIEKSVMDYTSEAFSQYDPADVKGLLLPIAEKSRQRFEETREKLLALCEPVEEPKDSRAYLSYFCARDSGNARQLFANKSKRIKLYEYINAYLRAFSNLANCFVEAGYTQKDFLNFKKEANQFSNILAEIKLNSGDYVDLKIYEPGMRHLIDTYISASDSEVLSAFDDLSLVNLVIAKGTDFIDKLPTRLKSDEKFTSSAIENNIRKIITEEELTNPKFYAQMSQLLDDLIEKHRNETIDYKQYLLELTKLSRQLNNNNDYPQKINSKARQALFDNLDRDEDLAIKLDNAIKAKKKDSWRGNAVKEKEVKLVIQNILNDEDKACEIFAIVCKQNEY